MPQATTNALDFLKGWTDSHAVDKSAKWASSVTLSRAKSGRVASLNSSGEFVLGVAYQAMPIFIIQSALDFDVANESDDTPVEWQPVQPDGTGSGLVAIGGYELESTEFDTTDTYVPNDTLTVTNADTAAQGKLDLYSSTLYTTVPVVGVVSQGAHTNHHKHSVISFWPVYIPTAAAGA